MFKIARLVLFFCIIDASISVWADTKPWFTGPLINVGLILVDEDQWVNFTVFNHLQLPSHKNWGVSSQNVFGITDKWSIQIIPEYSLNTRDAKTQDGWGDLQFILAYDVNRQKGLFGYPSFKLNFLQNVSTGKYDGLSLDPEGLDGFGTGANETGGGFNFQYLSMPIPDHYLQFSFSSAGVYSHKTKIKGNSVYGGGLGTEGEIEGGYNFYMDLTFELQLTQNWVGVVETFYQYTEQGDFEGNPGISTNGIEPIIARGKQNIWSLSPGIEYNFSEHFGIIAGVWFSLNDQNFNRFTNFQIAIDYSEHI